MKPAAFARKGPRRHHGLDRLGDKESMAYAIIEMGGKQYRVEKGDSLVVDRMSEDEGATVALEPLLLAGDKDPVLDPDELAKVKVEAVVQGHERGRKLRVVILRRRQCQPILPPRLRRAPASS